MAVVVGKKAQVVHLPFDRVTSVTLEPCTVRKLFRTIDTQRITIRAGGSDQPYVLRADQEGPYFEDYMAGFRKFCRENHITCYDKLR